MSVAEANEAFKQRRLAMIAMGSTPDASGRYPTLREIGAAFGVSTERVRQAFRKHRVHKPDSRSDPMNSLAATRSDRRKAIVEAALTPDAAGRWPSLREVGSAFGISSSAVSQVLRRERVKKPSNTPKPLHLAFHPAADTSVVEAWGKLWDYLLFSPAEKGAGR